MSLLHSEQGFYISGIGLRKDGEVSQISFLLFRLLCQNVAFVSMFSFDFS